MQTGVVIFEDNVVLRKSLCTLLESSERYRVLGDYGDALKAAEVVQEKRPDVVIMDIGLPQRDGIAAVQDIKETSPEISIIMYTQFEDDDKLFRSICAGADGYILKKTNPALLFDAIEQVCLGGAPLSPSIARKVLMSFRDERRSASKKFDLTPRELEILNLLVKGFSIKQIAADTFISYETVRTHLRNIYRKLHVNCGKEAIAKVLAEKIIIS